MKNGLEKAYELVVEKAKEGTVQSNLKPGTSAMGELKKAPNAGPEAAKGIDKPKEAEDKLNPGHGKIKTESQEITNMLPTSKFDELFKKQIIEEEGGIEGDESPVEMGGEGEFSDEQGDFPSETGDETGEEVDVATELRMIIDRLTEVAEKLGAFDEDMEEADEEIGETEAAEELGSEPAPKLAPESVQAKLKPLPDSTKKMQAKNNKVTSAFKASGKKASNTGGPGKGAADGKLNSMKKTTLGPNMSMKVDAKGTMSKPGAGVFDEI